MRVSPLILSCISGFLFAVSFVSPYLFWCVVPAFIVFLSLIKEEQSYTRIFWHSILIGTLHFGGVFLWGWTAFPIAWFMDAPSHIQLTMIGVYWALTSLVVGLPTAIFALLLKRLSTFKYDLLILAPILWLSCELVRSLLYSLYMLGDGGFVSASFSFGYVGYLFAHYGAYIQFAHIAGVYSLSLVVIFVCSSLYLFINSRYATHTYALGLLCIVAVAPFVLMPLFTTSDIEREVGDTNVFAIETRIGKEFMRQERAIEQKNNLLQEAALIALKGGATYLVMPEDASLSALFSTPDELFAWLNRVTEGRDVVVIENGMTKDARGVDVIRTYVYDTKTREVYFADKQYLVPQSEYISYAHAWLLSLFLDEEQLATIKRYGRARAGIMRTPGVMPEHLPGILFCFETSVPYVVKVESSTRTMPFIAHSVSHSWFQDADSLENQLAMMLKVHAVWSGVPIVRAGEMTQSLLYEKDGTIRTGDSVAQKERWTIQRFSF